MAAAMVSTRRANSLTRHVTRGDCRTVCTRERAHSGHRAPAIYFARNSLQLAATWTGGKQLRGSEGQSKEPRILVATPDEFP